MELKFTNDSSSVDSKCLIMTEKTAQNVCERWDWITTQKYVNKRNVLVIMDLKPIVLKSFNPRS